MAGSRKTIVRNSVLIAGGLFLGNVSSFVFRLVIARVYGPDSFGVFSIGFMLVSLTTTLALFGLPAGVTKFVSEYRSKNKEIQIFTILGICLIISLPLSVFLMVILIIIGQPLTENVLNSPNSAKFLQWFALQIPANILIHLTAAFALGYERGGSQVAIKEAIPKSLVLILTIGLIGLGGSIFDIGIGYVIARWLAGLIGLVILIQAILSPGLFNFTLHQPANEARSLLLYSTPLLLTTFTGFFLNWIDTFFIAFFLTDSDVGIYQTAFILGSSLSLFFTAISKSLFPNFSALISEGNRAEVSKRYSECIQWGLIIITAPFLYLIVFPATSLRILFGAEYAAAAIPLIVILIGQFVTMFFGPSAEVLKSIGDTQFVLYSYVAATLVNIFANISLIPNLGLTGAAIGTSAATSTLAILLFIKSSSSIELNLPIREFTRVILPGGVNSALFYFFFPTISSVTQFLFSILLFSVVYVLSLVFTGAIKEHHFSLALQHIRHYIFFL